ncbi:DNA repair protein rad13 [Pseudocercospora fuligena]|uniref:DNA repair protein rad13 n=1 Tax=Pseudocercospora fuligena TaxID=685502 RepID=A0A8H6R6Q8_9PEZI|nr:DNA repair protein rad13 [Pseudocercospora fuligena]
MGVTGLWQILQPCARPIKIETLNRKRLAVDASIWIYQFLKAVRDKEGNALRNSHVVGFFRRICKLLFFGIKPVFVFDGGAPALKRQTIRARKARREGRREDAAQTAAKILAKQMQHAAEEEETRRKAEQERGQGTAQQEEEAVPDEGLVYVDELQMTQQERQQNRKFRKKDAYHLPDLDVSVSEMGGPNDPRVMSLEELQAYARQFDTGEELNVYDFSKIDYDSAFFMSLPASDRYNILNAARLRSRLRMGYSKEQLDTMFPDRMAFSRFQIERVAERNELTQRLMNLENYDGMEFGGGRIAGEKSREYVLVKNDGVEGGWALGVISDEGKEEKPIDIDQPAPRIKAEDDEWEEDDDFEDVPIEGLNRLPKPKPRHQQMMDELSKQRRAVYQSKRSGGRRRPRRKPAQPRNELFVQSSSEEEAEEADAWEEVEPHAELFGEDEQQGSEDEELQRAIAMSLEKNGEDDRVQTKAPDQESEDDDMLEVFKQTAAAEARPIPKGSGRDIASIVNKRAYNTAPESREVTSFGVPTQKSDSSDEDDTMDFQAALAESRKNKRKTSPPRRQKPAPAPAKAETASDIAKKAGFKGPLPFEKLDLGTSLLGKKKMQERTEEAAGGFENPALAQKEQKTAGPLPPWFSGDVEKDMKAQRDLELEDRQRAREFNKQFMFQERDAPTIRRGDTGEVIDLDVDDENETSGPQEGAVIDPERADEDHASNDREHVTMGNMADEVRADPPQPVQTASPAAKPQELADIGKAASKGTNSAAPSTMSTNTAQEAPSIGHEESDEEMIEWSDSDREDHGSHKPAPSSDLTAEHTEGSRAKAVANSRSRSPSLEFEDVSAPTTVEQSANRAAQSRTPLAEPEFEDVGIHEASNVDDLGEVEEEDVHPRHTSGLVAQETIPEDEDFEDFSDPEEAEMLRNLTIEAEEHARFASTLNNKSQAQNIADYEKELKQLRNQQKKDRRDADEVTQTMIQECQALLRLFGLPYITAPMEAEAQCAELVHLGLVDGIVTDDSDCFLFGGTRIYKNMFNQAKFVECYLTSDLEKEFDLTREKLISIAQLLGSDYTEGLHGVGAVTALEIISEFSDLEAFKQWWTGVQTAVIPKSADQEHPFRRKFRKNATKLFLPPSFPDARVAMAYSKPEVDSNPEAFQFGVPDLDALRSFLMATIGWTQEHTDEVLVPVIKDMNRRLDEGTQANITAFFDGGVGIGAAGRNERGEAFAPRKRNQGSKRMGNALGKMAQRAKVKKSGTVPEAEGNEADKPVTEGVADAPTARGTAAKGQKRRKPKAPEQTAASADDESDFAEPSKKKTKRKSKTGGRKRAAQPDDE